MGSAERYFYSSGRVDSCDNGRSQGNGQVLSIMKAKSIDFTDGLEILSKRMKYLHGGPAI